MSVLEVSGIQFDFENARLGDLEEQHFYELQKKVGELEALKEVDGRRYYCWMVSLAMIHFAGGSSQPEGAVVVLEGSSFH